MKTNTLILTLSMMLIAVCSFARKPPVSVQKAFQQKFPGSLNVIWIKETVNLWEAFFTINGIKSSADFTEEGIWLNTEIQIQESELPIGLSDIVRSSSPDWIIEEINKIQTVSHGTIYAIDVRKGLFKRIITLNEECNLVNE